MPQRIGCHANVAADAVHECASRPRPSRILFGQNRSAMKSLATLRSGPSRHDESPKPWPRDWCSADATTSLVVSNFTTRDVVTPLMALWFETGVAESLLRVGDVDVHKSGSSASIATISGASPSMRDPVGAFELIDGKADRDPHSSPTASRVSSINSRRKRTRLTSAAVLVCAIVVFARRASGSARSMQHGRRSSRRYRSPHHALRRRHCRCHPSHSTRSCLVIASGLTRLIPAAAQQSFGSRTDRGQWRKEVGRVDARVVELDSRPGPLGHAPRRSSADARRYRCRPTTRPSDARGQV